MRRAIFSGILEKSMEDRIYICPCCEKEFILYHGGCKYCPACKAMTAPQRRAAINRRKEQEYADAHKAFKEAKEQDPFNPAFMSNKRLGAVINLFKMTYGTYTAAYRGGFIVQLLKAKGFEDPEKMINDLEVS